MGVEIIDADLLSYINSHVRDIRVFLATNDEVSRHYFMECDAVCRGIRHTLLIVESSRSPQGAHLRATSCHALYGFS